MPQAARRCHGQGYCWLVESCFDTCFPKRLPVQVAQDWQEADRPTLRWQALFTARSQDGCPRPRLRSLLSSPSTRRGGGRDSSCRAPVVFHRGGCRRGSLSRAMQLLCWWQVLLWVLGLPARGLEGECGRGRAKAAAWGDALPPAGSAGGAGGAGGGGGGRWTVEAEPAQAPQQA